MLALQVYLGRASRHLLTSSQDLLLRPTFVLAMNFLLHYSPSVAHFGTVGQPTRFTCCGGQVLAPPTKLVQLDYSPLFGFVPPLSEGFVRLHSCTPARRQRRRRRHIESVIGTARDAKKRRQQKRTRRKRCRCDEGV